VKAAIIIQLAQTNQHTSAHRGRAGIYHALPSLGLGDRNVSCGSQFTSGERPHFHPLHNHQLLPKHWLWMMWCLQLMMAIIR